MSRVNARILNKILTTDVDFTLPPNEDYELFEGWDETALAPGEIGINSFRSKAYMNTGLEIVTLSSDAIITLNGEDFINAESGEITDIELVDQDDVPIVPDSVVGNKITVTTGGGIGMPLMRSGQVTSYRTGDDASINYGRLVDFFTLDGNNPFGNTNRFTATDGTQTLIADIMIDWSTFDGTNVLGWYTQFYDDASSWNQAIDNSLAKSIGGFTSGWYLANIVQLLSIANYETASLNVFNYPPMNYTGVSWNVFTSTTSARTTTNCMVMTISDGSTFSFAKVNGGPRYKVCRTFTVTGTTLT